MLTKYQNYENKDLIIIYQGLCNRAGNNIQCLGLRKQAG